MTEMTREELVTFLNNRGGCTAVGLKTRTSPKMLKRGNPNANAKVERITRRNGFVGGSYESIVNNKQEREGGERDFEAKPLPWGQHAGRYFIEHKGSMYLKLFPTATGCKGEDRWEVDGVEVDLSVVQPYLPKSSPSASGVEWRTIALTSIEELTVDGETITLK